MNDWICDCCGEKFDNEVDLLAHLFNSSCEEELEERHQENDKFPVTEDVKRLAK